MGHASPLNASDLDRKPTSLGSPTGFDLKTGSGSTATVETQATYGYNPLDGRLSTLRSGDIPVLTHTSMVSSWVKIP